MQHLVCTVVMDSAVNNAWVYTCSKMIFAALIEI